MHEPQKTISLVLGSGGARGFDIRSISGSSIDALVGGIYAAGEMEAYTEWACALERLDVLRLLAFLSAGRHCSRESGSSIR